MMHLFVNPYQMTALVGEDEDAESHLVPHVSKDMKIPRKKIAKTSEGVERYATLRYANRA